MIKSPEHIIKDCVIAITKTSVYKTWYAGLKTIAEDDIIQLNNSFIFRDVTTSKNDKYIGFSVSAKGIIKEYYIIQGIGSNSDFKYISSKSSNFSKFKLSDAIKLEKKTLGRLLYILIGTLEDNIVLEVEINNPAIKKIVLDPAASATRIIGGVVYIHDTMDDALIWNEISKHYKGDPDFDNNEEKLKNNIANAIDELERESYSILKIPEKIKRTHKSVTESLVEMLDLQIRDYKSALIKCKGDPTTDKHSFNELLRIGYNFSSDALTFIRLIVSVCDLKPLVLWGTIKEHYELSESFKNLPWIRSNKKPSLSNYKGIIGSARNSSFHNLFPFKRSVDIVIPDKSLKQITLRTFSEYTRRKENELKFQDKELVDVLIEFTRSNEHKVPQSFWQKNLEIFTATKNMLSSTAYFLKQLHKES